MTFTWIFFCCLFRCTKIIKTTENLIVFHIFKSLNKDTYFRFYWTVWGEAKWVLNPYRFLSFTKYSKCDLQPVQSRAVFFKIDDLLIRLVKISRWINCFDRLKPWAQTYLFSSSLLLALLLQAVKEQLSESNTIFKQRHKH